MYANLSIASYWIIASTACRSWQSPTHPVLTIKICSLLLQQIVLRYSVWRHYTMSAESFVVSSIILDLDDLILLTFVELL